MTIEEMNKISKQLEKLNYELANLEKFRIKLAHLVKLKKTTNVITVGYDVKDVQFKNDFFTEYARFPVAVLIQQAIYDCMAIERNIISLGGVVPSDPY